MQDQVEPEAKQWRPVTYGSRAFTDIKRRYSQLEKEAKAVEWGLYGMRNTSEVETDHKPLEPLLSGYRTTVPLCIERICVYLQGFNYHPNYIPRKKEGLENNEADYRSRHPEPLALQKSRTCKSQAEFDLRQTVEEFKKYIMAVVKSSVPDAVTWQELLEETHSETELTDLKEAIARGYFTVKEKRAIGPQYDSIFTWLAVTGELVVCRTRWSSSHMKATRVSPRPRSTCIPERGFQGCTKWWRYTSSTDTCAKW